MLDYLRDCFLESTGIDLNEMYLVTKIKAEYLENPWMIREMTIYNLPQINENKGEFEDDLYRIAYSIHHKEIDDLIKIINYPNYKMLILTYKSSDGMYNSTIQEMYEFVRK